VISAVGVVGNTKTSASKSSGQDERGCIVIDGYCKTNVPGSMRSRRRRPPMLAHQGEHEGRRLRRGPSRACIRIRWTKT